MSLPGPVLHPGEGEDGVDGSAGRRPLQGRDPGPQGHGGTHHRQGWTACE